MWVSIILKVAILVQIDELQQSLTGMNFGLVVLAIHEDIEKAHRGIKLENLRQVTLLIIYVLRITSCYSIDFVESLNKFGCGNAKIPDNLWCALLQVFELTHNQINNFLNVVFDIDRHQQLFAILVLFLLMIKQNQILNDEAKSPNGARSYLLLVAGL